MPSSWWGKKIEITTLGIALAHLVLLVTLIYGYEEHVELPMGLLWPIVHALAAVGALWFLAWPSKWSKSIGGAVSLTAFGARTLAYGWVLAFDRRNSLYLRLGHRFFVQWASWAVMTGMSYLLWWWMSGFQRQQRTD